MARRRTTRRTFADRDKAPPSTPERDRALADLKAWVRAGRARVWDGLETLPSALIGLLAEIAASEWYACRNLVQTAISAIPTLGGKGLRAARPPVDGVLVSTPHPSYAQLRLEMRVVQSEMLSNAQFLTGRRDEQVPVP